MNIHWLFLNKNSSQLAAIDLDHTCSERKLSGILWKDDEKRGLHHTVSQSLMRKTRVTLESLVFHVQFETSNVFLLKDGSLVIVGWRKIEIWKYVRPMTYDII